MTTAKSPRAKRKPKPKPKADPLTNPLHWFETEARIRGKAVGPAVDLPPEANPMQVEIGRAVEWCLANDQPVRLIVYKPRQKGCSTINVALVYARTRALPMTSLIMGGQTSQTNNLWNILRHYAKHDKHDWDNTWRDTQNSATCSNGSTFARETAGDKEAGRSGTYHAVIATEVARWPGSGAKNAHEVLNSVLNCVPNLPGTFVILESTACGPVGPFPATWAGAVALDQMMAGHKGNGYIRIFAPWYIFPDSTMPLTQAEKDSLRERLTAARDTKALRLMDELQLSPECIAYYHHLLHSPECGGDPMKRDREYPTTPEDGFQASSPSRFSLHALDQIDAYARSRAAQIEYGNLGFPAAQKHLAITDRDYRRAIWMPASPADCDFAILEHPVPRMSYIIATDNMTGESHVTGADPDCNAAIVLRDGHLSTADRCWHPPEVVACIFPHGWTPNATDNRHGNRKDMDQFADLVALLSGYYGNALIVPESNRAEYLISELRKRRANLWLRQPPADHVDTFTEPKRIGFHTNRGSKKSLVENLAKHIREHHHPEDGFKCAFPWINNEFRTFVRHPDGTEGALKVTGCHDDQVIATAIALLCKDQATRYYPLHSEDPNPTPPDLREEKVVREVW